MTRTSHCHFAHLRSGQLADLPFGQLLHAFAVARRTLCFEIRRRHIRKTIVLEDGRPVDCRSNLVHETLGRFLVSEGQLSEFQYEGVLAGATRSGARTGEVLIELGLISESDLQIALQASLGRKLLECFTWQDGEFRVLSELPESEIDVVAEINVAQLLFTGATRFAPETQVGREIGPLIGKDLILEAAPPIALESVQLSAPQQRMINRLRRPIAAEELLQNAGMSKGESLRTLYALSIMGLVGVAAAEGAASSTVAIHEEADEGLRTEELFELGELEEPIKTDAEPSTQASPEKFLREIAHEYEHYRHRDPSAILAGVADRRRRYVELCQRYSPSRFEVPELAPVAEMAAELLSLTVRAYAAGSEFAEPELPIVCITELSASDQTELATEYDEQASEQLSSGNFGAAMDLLGLANDCAPDNTRHAVDLAYARFRENAECAQESLNEMLALTRAGYSSPLVYLYCAEISSSLGDASAAETFFHTGCELWNGLLAYR